MADLPIAFQPVTRWTKPWKTPRRPLNCQRKREFRQWTWGLVTIDIASLPDKAERINITLPPRMLRRIDQAAKAAAESRSGYIARRALG